MTRRNVTAVVEGQTYQIPEAWIVGATRTFGSFSSAVQQWHDQAQMEKAANG